MITGRTWILTGILVVIVSAAIPASEASFQVKIEKDLAYKSGAGLDAYEKERCLLDLYLPQGAKAFPTMLYFHGGGLTLLDKNDPATQALARIFAQAGVAVAVVNYRLSPRAKFPAYLDDAAAASAWVLGTISRYQGNPKRVFIAGHSAGGYLTLMLALDGSYLAKYNIKPAQISGFIPISAQTFTHSTIREERGIANPETTPMIDAAAPCYHAQADAPAILVLCADGDTPDRKLENQYLTTLLAMKGHRRHRYLEIQGHDHMTLITEITKPQDPVFAAVIEFINSNGTQTGEIR